MIMRKIFVAAVCIAQFAPIAASAERASSAELCKKFGQTVVPMTELIKDAGMFATVIRLFSKDESHRQGAEDLAAELTAGMKEFNSSFSEIAEMCRG
ncbi:hypothetical protein DSW25_15290 [Sulfitobacter donghicola DSW-25 = KCTC 12864 = JCM 14565]|uniref:Uncharacterized protein n=3 Tax=Sulfitobacter TaxID=60136 RepID=A0A073IT71_9RHOB|nr:hypothetical protein DSW25_15290 [Sulfitobacter donghicola DSW-25 = KCTC 12864 = JCM 14565]